MKSYSLKLIRAFLQITRFYRPLAPLSRKSKFISKLMPQCDHFSPNSIEVFHRDQIRFQGDLSDYLDWKFYFSPWNEERKLLLSKLNEGDCIIEVGAHHGATCLAMANRIGKNGLIYSFEASKLNFLSFKNNIDLNKLKFIHPVNMAISDQDGIIYLESGPARNSSGSAITNITKQSEEVINCISLDHWINVNGIQNKIDWLKITVNGHEFKALKGAISLIKNQRPKLYFELSSVNLKKQGSDANEFLQWLESFNYQLINAETGNLFHSSEFHEHWKNFDVIAMQTKGNLDEIS